MFKVRVSRLSLQFDQIFTHVRKNKSLLAVFLNYLMILFNIPYMDRKIKYQGAFTLPLLAGQLTRIK